MFAIGLRYLCGWAMASDPADRAQPEWPPHPDRIFMALAAAHFETDGSPAEREALVWLEQQDPPTIRASEATARETVTTFVPVNDLEPPRLRAGKPVTADLIGRAVKLLPERRPRQPRQFPVAIPREPVVYLQWNAAPTPAIRDALAGLCAKVVRVGHSASLVQAWVEDAPPEPSLVPTEGVARESLRVSGPGRLDHLATQFEKGFRPERSLWQGYGDPPASPAPSMPASVFDDRLLVLRCVSGTRLGLESTLLVTSALRNAVMKACTQQPPPEWVSGHTPDGRASPKPHLAFLPLPFVGSEHADGHLLGMALAVPREREEVPVEEVARCLRKVVAFDSDGSPLRTHVYDGGRFDWTVELEGRESPPVALKSEAWTRPARRWATVTPIVFDRHGKGKDLEREAEEMISVACKRIGLPEPAEVALVPVSAFIGVPHQRDFPHMTRKSDGGRMHHAHAVLTFAEPVRGPVLLGAGRFLGYGLCRPVQEGGDEWSN